MNMFANLVLTVQIMSALGVIGLVLIQHGKGADMGAAFGSGSSGSLFGATGGANFLSRSTAALAGVFFVCTLALAYMGNTRPASAGSVLEKPAAVAPAVVPDAGSAAAIPGAAAPAVAPAVQASGAGQTPAK